MGPGFCPEFMRKSGSGVAADQTNAMLAISKEVISLHRTPALRFRPQTAFLFPCGCLLAMPGNLPQIAAQRPNRVNRGDHRYTLGIVTFGTAQLDEPLPVAAAHHTENSDFA